MPTFLARNIPVSTKYKNHLEKDHNIFIPLLFFVIYCFSFIFHDPITHIYYGYWQLLPLDALLQHPISSLLLIHSQPPLLNLLFYIVHIPSMIWEINPQFTATLLFFFISLFSIYVYYNLVFLITKNKVCGMAVLSLILLNPGFSFFQGYFFYQNMDFLVSGILVYQACLWALKPDLYRFGGVVIVYTTMVYLRSLWHPLFGFFIVLFLPLMIYPKMNKKIIQKHWIYGSLLFILLISPWMLKNLILFNTPSFSSWLGGNLGGQRFSKFILSNNPADAFDNSLVKQYYSDWQLKILMNYPATADIEKNLISAPPLHEEKFKSLRPSCNL